MKRIKIMSSIILLLIFGGCKKYLDEKSDKKLVVPTTLADLQALLDNYGEINDAPGTGEASSDDYYLSDADYSSLSQESSRRIYAWHGSLLFDLFPNNWSRSYDIIYFTNVVFEGLEKIQRAENPVMYDQVKGQASFIRGLSFLQASYHWCKPYDPLTSANDMGLPLRLYSDFNLPSVRSSVKETYEQVLSDLTTAAQLLPNLAVHVMRPSRAAAYAALAKTFLSMNDFLAAEAYADSSLQIYNKLLDYNTLNTSATFPVPALNVEIIYQQNLAYPNNLANSRAKIDSLLYLSYASNDLRKTIFFRSNNNGTFGFRGGYNASSNLFGGLTTDEVYLTRAECRARNGNVTGAMDDLNTLLIKRWKTGTFIPYTASGKEDAINKILAERRKELLMRGIRWADIKRLNLIGANIILKRFSKGQIITLLPNDPRYALPIPEEVIQRTGMLQNPK